MITIGSGLEHSLKVLEYLKKDKSLKKIDIHIGTFTNCREEGLTFVVMAKECFTFCVYEHRNSDQIIINGKKGLISMAGDLPYCSESKWDSLDSFSYNEDEKASKKLSELIRDFWNKYKED